MFYGIYERLREDKTKAVLKIQSEIMHQARCFLREKGFTEIRAPLIEPFTDPGLRGAQIFELDFYGASYQLTSALTLHKPLLATHLGKVFAFCPCLRKEDMVAAKTGRHLAEFCQIEVEIPDADYQKAMDVAEKLLCSIIKGVKVFCKTELFELGRKLRTPKIPFKKLKYDDCVVMARELGFEVKSGCEIPWEVEKEISMRFKDPFFIVDYPHGSRGFYDKAAADYLLSFDLMYPEGFGEAASGSEREYEYEKVKEKIKGLEESERYVIYLELLRKGVKPTAGFGIGLERLTRYIGGLKSIEDAALFPKLPGAVAQ